MSTNQSEFRELVYARTEDTKNRLCSVKHFAEFYLLKLQTNFERIDFSLEQA